MIDNATIALVEDMLKRSRPRFSDLTVGDINEGNIDLLRQALDGDDKALFWLLKSVPKKEYPMFN